MPANLAEGPEVLLAFADDGCVVALAGHVDLGTGLQTAYAQLVAEELGLPLSRVTVILGDTARAPNQGPTIASASIQIHALPLRQAAAQARRWLLDEAARALGLTAESVDSIDGQACAVDGRRILFGTLVAGRHVELMLDPPRP